MVQKVGSRRRLLIAAVGCLALCAPIAAASPLADAAPRAMSTATSAPSYDPAGTDENPAGASAQWHLPSMAVLHVGTMTRLIRSVNTTPADGGTGVSPSHSMSYLDLGHGSWTSVSGAPNIDLLNTVTTGSAGQETLHSFVSGKQTSAGQWAMDDYRTTDGIHWSMTQGTVTMSGSIVAGDVGAQGIIPYRGVETLPDGTWLMPVYFRRCNTAAPCSSTDSSAYHFATGLLASANQGQSWTKPALPFASTNDYTEASVVRRPADGRLVMVARWSPPFPQSSIYPDRKDVYSGSSLDSRNGGLLFRVSSAPVNTIADLAAKKTDGTPAITWSAPAVTIPTVKTVPNSTTIALGVSPQFTHVGSRIMLTFGRPGDVIAWNYDGTATNWTDVEHLGYPLSNLPAQCDPDKHHPQFNGSAAYEFDLECDSMGSSGYMGVAVTDAAQGVAYLIGDTCHVWSCKRPRDTEGVNDYWPDVNWPSPNTDWYQRAWLVRVTSRS